jgi:hypothetical protein
MAGLHSRDLHRKKGDSWFFQRERSPRFLLIDRLAQPRFGRGDCDFSSSEPTGYREYTD